MMCSPFETTTSDHILHCVLCMALWPKSLLLLHIIIIVMIIMQFIIDMGKELTLIHMTHERTI